MLALLDISTENIMKLIKITGVYRDKSVSLKNEIAFIANKYVNILVLKWWIKRAWPPPSGH